MFNMKKHQKQSQVAPYEKYLREEDVAPKADDRQPIWEKSLKHWTGDKGTTTEDQMQKEWDGNDDAPVIEKVLNEAKSKYVTHRSDATWLSVPPINALVEKIRQDRLAKDYKTEKESHWSHSYDEKSQQGALPKWPKIAPQHNKIVLNNDPERFKGVSSDLASGSSGKVRKIVGDITTADVDNVAHQIKIGSSVDYDTAIVAILRQANQEKRELSSIEQKSVVDLKVARTKALLKNAKSNK